MTSFVLVRHSLKHAEDKARPVYSEMEQKQMICDRWANMQGKLNVQKGNHAPFTH